MKRLFTIDLKNYAPGDAYFRRPSARAVILKPDNKIALVYSNTHKYYKFPGGGIHKDEDKTEALIREVKEESGMVVKPESIREFGSVLRLQASEVAEHTIFEQENFYYFCEVEEKVGEQELDAYEFEDGYELRIVDIDEAIKTNDAFVAETQNLSDKIMIERESRVLSLLKTI